MSNGGELLVRTLVEAGVRDAFVLHGGHLDPIFQACLDHGVRLLDTRHEAAAGHAADSYARQTGRIGVAIATAGPGYTNILTAVTQAYLDCSPVLFIVGAAPLRDAEKWPLQGGVDQIAMAKPVTKWACQITRTDQIPHLTAHAVRTALSGRPGPVLIEVPIDVLFTPIADDIAIPQMDVPGAAAPTPAQVRSALDLLASAERPVIVAGGGVLYSQAGPALRELAETIGVPVFANSKALGVVPYDHPLSGHSQSNLFALGATGQGPDVALFIGARFGMFTSSERILPADCKLIQVDADAREFGRLRHVDVGIAADCRETALAFRDAARARRWPDFGGWARRVHDASRWHETAYADVASSTTGAVHPYVAVREVMAALDPDTIVCADGGETSQWTELLARPSRVGQLTSHGYLGCLGIGMPFAIGAQVAHPDKRVVVIVGDGSAGLNVQEFDTMVRHGLPIVTVVLNNKAWGMCVHGQQAMYGANRLVVTKLGDGRYDRVAEGFGCLGGYVDSADGVRAAARAALASGRPACINVITDLNAVFGSATAPRDARATSKDEVAMPYYDSLKTAS